MTGGLFDEPQLDPKGLIRRHGISKRSRLHGTQARFLARLIEELESALIRLYGVRSAQELRFGGDQDPKPWDTPEFLRFVEGAMACGFVCEDYPAGELVPLAEVNRNPQRVIQAMTAQDLRRYIHTLHRADKWADGYASPIMEALASGALQVAADRLKGDESLYEPHG